jgi:hypothetical protein
MKKQHFILFRVIAQSSNANSFGLRGHVLISRTGLACEVGLNYLNARPVGDSIRVPVHRSDLRSAEELAGAVARKLHGEIPRSLPKAPREVIRQVYTLAS